MKFLVILSLVGAAFCARLDNTYLPPAGAGGAGGYQSPGFGGAPSRGFGSGGGGGGAGRYPGGGGGGGGGGRYSGGGGGGAHIPILRYDNDNDGTGNYNYNYETGNGIKAQERGQPNGPEGAVTAQGSFSYTGDDGQQYAIQYTADENGFRPVGAHLPTPPPIPEAILRSIEQNKAEAARGGGNDDGQYRPSGGSGFGGGPAGSGGYGGGSGGSGGFGGGAGGSGGFGGGGAGRTYVPPRPSGSFSPQSGYNY